MSSFGFRLTFDKDDYPDGPFPGWTILLSTKKRQRSLSFNTASSAKKFEVRPTRHHSKQYTFPLFKSTSLEFESRQPITQLVGLSSNFSLPYLLDEFDFNFNELAIATLRYHLDYSVCDNEGSREEWEQLIMDLSKEKLLAPELSPAQSKHHDLALEHPFLDGSEPCKQDANTNLCPICESSREANRAAVMAHKARTQDARARFLEVIPLLWS